MTNPFAVPVSDPAVEQEVTAQFGRTKNEVEMLGETINALTERLYPVLRQGLTGAGANSKQSELGTPFGNELRDLSEKIAYANERLNDILRNLGI